MPEITAAMLTPILEGVKAIIPVALPVILSFLGIRKAISFLCETMRGA